MKRMCVICLSKWFDGKSRNKLKRLNKYFTMCDECLISIPIRHFKDLPPI